MLKSLAVGIAIFLGFFALWAVGLHYLLDLIRLRLVEDDKRKNLWWRIGFGCWMIVLAGLFALMATTEWAQPVAKLTPFVVVCSVWMAVVGISRWDSTDD